MSWTASSTGLAHSPTLDIQFQEKYVSPFQPGITWMPFFHELITKYDLIFLYITMENPGLLMLYHANNYISVFTFLWITPCKHSYWRVLIYKPLNLWLFQELIRVSQFPSCLGIIVWCEQCLMQKTSNLEWPGFQIKNWDTTHVLSVTGKSVCCLLHCIVHNVCSTSYSPRLHELNWMPFLSLWGKTNLWCSSGSTVQQVINII